MSVVIKPNKVEVSTGVDISLTQDAATHLSYALNGYRGLCKQYGHNGSRGGWPWLDNFIEQLDKARGSGCTMGGRL